MAFQEYSNFLNFELETSYGLLFTNHKLHFILLIFYVTDRHKLTVQGLLSYPLFIGFVLIKKFKISICN